MDGTGHSRIAIVGGVAGILGSITSILTWANITPEMVGETLYRYIYVIIPFLMALFGFIIGWSLTRLHYESIILEMTADEDREESRAVQVVQHMDMRLKIALEAVRSQIYLVVPHGKVDANDYLDELHEMGLVDYETCPEGRRWFLTEASRALIERHPDLMEGATRVLDEER